MDRNLKNSLLVPSGVLVWLECRLRRTGGVPSPVCVHHGRELCEHRRLQIHVSGVARYGAKQRDQLPTETHSGRYDLISHSVTVEGVNATGIDNYFEVGNDIGYGGPPPWTDVFCMGSWFSPASPIIFGNGLTLTGVRICGLDNFGAAISSDSIFVINPAAWDLQGGVTFIGAAGQVTISAFRLESIRVCRVTGKKCL